MIDRQQSLIVKTVCRRLIPFIQLFGLYVVIHGHESPGGGFQAGVIVAASIILLRLVRGQLVASVLTSRNALTLACLGPLLYGGIGIASLFFGGNFLDYGVFPFPMESSEVRAMGTLGIEIGVAVGVAGVLVLIFDALARWEDGTL